MMDERGLIFMREAAQLAVKGRYSTSPNPAVGCVVVKGDSIVGRGYHKKAGSPHAEVLALSEAGDDAAGSEVYITLEPCNHQGRTGPCTTALINAGVKKVIYAVQDPNPGVAGSGGLVLKEHGINVTVGLGEELVQHLNNGFLKRMMIGKPKVRIKVGMSLDGNSAMQSGESKWITGAEARQDVQNLRAESCGILTGIGTVLEDDPSLNVRDNSLPTLGRQPHRIVLDPGLRMPPNAKMLDMEGQTFVFTASPHAGKWNEIEKKGGVIVLLDQTDNVFDLEKVFSKLADLEVNELLIEAGARLTSSILETGLWDELIIYLAPKVLGRSGKKALGISSPKLLSDVLQLRLRDEKLIGDDLRLVFERYK